MFTNKKIFILGMARSGYEAAKLLIKLHNEVIVNDIKTDQDESHVRELRDLGVNVVLGEHPENLFNQNFDYLIKNPGISLDHIYVQKARELNIPVINEVELAYELFPKDINIIGITGSNGKTTTTTLIYEILKAAGKPVHLVGNIGFPVSGFVDKVKPGDFVVMEISVQQLCNMTNFKAHVSVLTNLFEAHLDFMGNYQNYMAGKKKIFNHHNANDYAVLNMDNNDVMELTSDIPSSKLYFSSKKPYVDGCYIKNDAIYYFYEKIIDTKDIKIKGIHNYENIMAAILATKKFDVSNEVIVDVLKTFAGVEHRIEFVANMDGREIYNDSKSTNVKATQTALSSFDKPVVLLLGGLDRGHSFDGLKEYLKNTKAIVCYGQTKDRIKAFAEELKIDCEVTDTLEEATKKAYKLSSKGDVILLSPACASWDQFKDFEERGKMFKDYVRNLK